MVSLKEFEQNRESGGVVTDPGEITKEETESRAIKAIGRAMEALEKSTPTSVTKATNASKSFSGHRAQGLSHVKRSDPIFPSRDNRIAWKKKKNNWRKGR